LIYDNDQNNTEFVMLDGSGSTDRDSLITGHFWTENGIEIAAGMNPTVELSVGTHLITLTVTDDVGAVSTDEVIITVEGTTVSCDFNSSDTATLVAAINDANANGTADNVCLADGTFDCM